MEASNESTDEPLWTPTPERVAAANITRFAASVGHRGSSYAELHRWSTDDAGKVPDGLPELPRLDRKSVV